jgi:hypothetical protein
VIADLVGRLGVCSEVVAVLGRPGNGELRRLDEGEVEERRVCRHSAHAPQPQPVSGGGVVGAAVRSCRAFVQRACVVT